MSVFEELEKCNGTRFMQPLADLALMPRCGAIAMSELCVDALLKWAPRRSLHADADTIAARSATITGDAPATTPFARLYATLPVAPHALLDTLAFIFAPASYPAPQRKTDARTQLAAALAAQHTPELATEADDQKMLERSSASTSYRPLCGNACGVHTSVAHADGLRALLVRTVVAHIDAARVRGARLDREALAAAAAHHLVATRAVSTSDAVTIAAWLARAALLARRLPPSASSILAHDALVSSAALAEGCLPPLCTSMVSTRAFLYKDEEIGFRPSVLREVCLMRLLSAPRQCLHVALDAATGGVLFLLPRARVPATGRHNLLTPPSNRKSDVHLHLKLAWLYQYLAAMCYFHERGAPYIKTAHPSLLLEGRCVAGLANVIDGGGIEVDAAAAHCFSGAVEVMCSGDALPLGNILYQAPEVLLSKTHVARDCATDMWTYACAVHHLFCDLFLFPINAENSTFTQCIEIFKLLGTPSESTWPGVSRLANFTTRLPAWDTSAYDAHFDGSGVDAAAVAFMRKLFVCNPSARMRAVDAMRDEFFAPLRVAYAAANRGAALPTGADAFAVDTMYAFQVAQERFYRRQRECAVAAALATQRDGATTTAASAIDAMAEVNENGAYSSSDDELVAATAAAAADVTASTTAATNTIGALMANGAVSRIGNHSAAMTGDSTRVGAFVPVQLHALLSEVHTPSPQSALLQSPPNAALSARRGGTCANFAGLPAQKCNSIRATLCDWLIEVAREFRLNDDSLFLAVAVLDRALTVMACGEADVQLVAEVSLLIASKIVDCSRIVASQFVTIAAGAYTVAQLKAMELQMLDALDFDVFLPTPLQMLRHVLARLLPSTAEHDAQHTALAAQYVLEAFLPSAHYNSFGHLTLAVCAVQLALDCTDVADVPSTLLVLPGVRELVQRSGGDRDDDGIDELRACYGLMRVCCTGGLVVNQSTRAPLTSRQDAMRAQHDHRPSGVRQCAMSAARSKYARENVQCVSNTRRRLIAAGDDECDCDPFATLHVDLCQYVLSFLPPMQRGAAALVSQHWRTVAGGGMLWRTVDFESSAERLDAGTLHRLAARALRHTERLGLAQCRITPLSLISVLDSATKLRRLDLRGASIECAASGRVDAAGAAWLQRNGLAASSPDIDTTADMDAHELEAKMDLERGDAYAVDVRRLAELLAVWRSLAVDSHDSLPLVELDLEGVGGLCVTDVCALIGMCPSLSALNLSQCEANDKSFMVIFGALQHSHADASIALHRMAVTLSPVASAAQAPLRGVSLTALHLSGCTLITDASVVAVLSACTALRTLSIAECPRLTNATLARMPRTLTSLNAALNASLSDAGVVELVVAAPHLEMLDLSFCVRLTHTAIRAIATLRALRWLNCASLEALTTIEPLLHTAEQRHRFDYLNLSGCSLLPPAAFVNLGRAFQHCISDHDSCAPRQLLVMNTHVDAVVAVQLQLALPHTQIFFTSA